MKTERPSLDFKARFEGAGVLIRGDASLPVRRFDLERVKHDYSAPWRVSLEASDAVALHAILRDSDLALSLRGMTDDHEHLHIAQLHWVHAEGARLQAEVFDFDLDAERLEGTPDAQTIRVYLTDNAIAREEHHLLHLPSGQVEAHGPVFSPKSWELGIGIGTLSQVYSYEKASIGAAEATVQIPLPLLSVEVGQDRLTGDTKKLLSTSAQDLKDSLRLLSFLSRQHVSWTTMRLASYTTGDTDRLRRHPPAQRFHAGRASPRASYMMPLVHPGRLSDDALTHLRRGVLALPYKDAVLLSMAFLIQGPREETAESSIAMAFTGLEALVNAIGEHDGSSYVLGKGEFKRYEACLRKATGEYGQSFGWDKSFLGELYQKLRGLRRAAITPRVAALVAQHDVVWQDLWPDGVALEAGLKAEYQVRNDLIHRGEIRDPLRAHAAALRIHALAERLLYTLIGGKPEWLDLQAYKGHCSRLKEDWALPKLH